MRSFLTSRARVRRSRFPALGKKPSEPHREPEHQIGYKQNYKTVFRERKSTHTNRARMRRDTELIFIFGTLSQSEEENITRQESQQVHLGPKEIETEAMACRAAELLLEEKIALGGALVRLRPVSVGAPVRRRYRYME
ncbi:uncharacterized [Tachysurus ichikawai]